ncbi:hypothetical protein KAI87_13750 [Myxococcota bacterium]|nr:hypothetical protein [Myxococcota bacterium]
MVGSDYEKIFKVLSEGGVRYLVVGGVAVVFHGHGRMTADLDLVIQFEESNILAAIRALESLGYRPRAPVPFLDFADSAKRKLWLEEKGLMVFSLWSNQLAMTEVDIFIKEPFDFEEAWARRLDVDLDGIQVTIASRDDIIRLKEAAGRPKDLEDIRVLRILAGFEEGKGDE